jgi:hypothetical protein
MNAGSADSYKVWADDDSAYGPVDTATLIQWVQDARVSPETFVQSQADLRWRQASDVEALRGKFSAAADSDGPSTGGDGSLLAAKLGEFSVFSGLSKSGLEQLAALGKFYQAAPDTLIVRQGDPCDAVYFVVSGGLRVRLLIGIANQQDQTLCKLGGGEFFGEMGMFLQNKRTADVIAETESCLFRMTTNAFRLLANQIPELAAPVLFNLGVTMARRVAEDNQRFYREVTSQFLWS